jgi:hypothetical protein
MLLCQLNSRISISYKIGLISASFARDLNLVRKIRNDFAHNVTGCSFEDTGVKSRILELAKSTCLIEKFPNRRKGYPVGTRGDFQMIIDWMLFQLNWVLEESASFEACALELAYSEDFSEDSHISVPENKESPSNFNQS